MRIGYVVVLRCLDCSDTGEIEVYAKTSGDAEVEAVERWGHDKHGTYHGRSVGQARAISTPLNRAKRKPRVDDPRSPRLPL